MVLIEDIISRGQFCGKFWAKMFNSENIAEVFATKTRGGGGEGFSITFCSELRCIWQYSGSFELDFTKSLLLIS